MNKFGDVILILVGVLLIIVSRPFAEAEVRRYKRWSERWFGPMFPPPQYAHWAIKFAGAAFALVGVASILGYLK